MRGLSGRRQSLLVFGTIGILLVAGLIVVAMQSTDNSKYDYLVSSNTVMYPDGKAAFEGKDFAAALNWAVSQPNKATYVPSGQYIIRENIDQFASGVTLLGAGQEKTIFSFVWPGGSNSYNSEMFFGFHAVNVNDVTFSGFTITDDGAIRFDTTSGTTHNNMVRDVTVRDTSDLQVSSIGSWVSNDCVADGYKFIRCTTKNTGGDGFDLWGREENATADLAHGGINQNVYFEDCKATYVGATNRFWSWGPGFDIGEHGRTNHVKLVRCEASNNWESGFHFEEAGVYPNFTNTYITMTDCVANYNGQRWADPRGAGFGYGCAISNPTTYSNPSNAASYDPGTFVDLTTFKAVGNTGKENGGACGDKSRYDYTQEYYTYQVKENVVTDLNGTTVHTDSSFTGALQWACSQSYAVVYVPRYGYGSPISVTDTIELADGVTLYAVPRGGQWPEMQTVLQFSENGTDGFLIKDKSNTQILNAVIINGDIRYEATNGAVMKNNSVKGVLISNTTPDHSAGLSTYCDSTSSIDGLELRDVDVLNSHADGFSFGGDGGASVSNLKILFCRADNSGLTSPRNNESVGYRFGDGVKMSGVTTLMCHSNNNWCSGFFFTANAQLNSIVLQDCSASYNGQNGDAANGFGYQLNGQTGVKLQNCKGVENKGSLTS